MRQRDWRHTSWSVVNGKPFHGMAMWFIFSSPAIPSPTGQSISARIRRACRARICPGTTSMVCIRSIAARASAKIVISKLGAVFGDLGPHVNRLYFFLTIGSGYWWCRAEGRRQRRRDDCILYHSPKKGGTKDHLGFGWYESILQKRVYCRRRKKGGSSIQPNARHREMATAHKAKILVSLAPMIRVESHLDCRRRVGLIPRSSGDRMARAHFGAQPLRHLPTTRLRYGERHVLRGSDVGSLRRRCEHSSSFGE